MPDATGTFSIYLLKGLPKSNIIISLQILCIYGGETDMKRKLSVILALMFAVMMALTPSVEILAGFDNAGSQIITEPDDISETETVEEYVTEALPYDTEVIEALGDGGFSPRTTAPDRGDGRYYGSGNPFPAQGANCTWYAFGRAWEIMGYKPGLCRGNACDWWYYNDGFPRGSQPRLGAVMCWGGARLNGYGHVAVVEAINNNGTITYSESSYSPAYTFKLQTKSPGSLSTDYGTFQGYIYIPGSGDPTPKGEVMSAGYNRTIPDGNYQIVSADDPALNLNVDVPGDTFDVSGSLDARVWHSRGNKYDVFTVKYLDNGFYSIKHYGSDLSLDVSGASVDMGANVGFYTSNGSNAQQWAISEYDIDAEKWYRVQSKCNGWYLDVENAGMADNTNIRMWIANGGIAQNWIFVPWTGDETEQIIPDGDYHIASMLDENYVLGVEDGDYPGIVLKKDRGIDTVFHVQYNSVEKTYELINKWNDDRNMLDVETNASTSKKAGLWVKVNYDKPYETVQKWVIRPGNEEGTYNIVSYRNGLFLDVLNGVVSEGQGVQIHTSNQADAQKWKFVDVGKAPSMKNVTISNAEIGTEYGAELSADGTSPLTWKIAAGRLPEGITLDENTGRISGIPVSAGKYSFTVEVMNAFGSDHARFEIEVSAKETEPAITPEPTSGNVIIVSGQKADLTKMCFAGVTDTISRYKSDDTRIVSVSAKGLASGKKKGTATVEAQIKEGSSYKTVASCEITVLDKPKLKFARPFTYVGQEFDANEYFITEDTVLGSVTTWTSDKPDVIEVIDAQNGDFRVKNSGSTRITAYFGEPGKVGTLKVSAAVSVRFPAFAKNEYNLMSGDKLPISMKNVPASLEAEWDTENEEVFTITPQLNKKGTPTGKVLIEAVEPGEALCTVSVDGQAYTCTVKVTEPKLNTEELTLSPGASKVVTIKNTRLKKNQFAWISDDEEIATVDKDGKIKAQNAGETDIYALYGSIVLKCHVKVNDRKG